MIIGLFANKNKNTSILILKRFCSKIPKYDNLQKPRAVRTDVQLVGIMINHKA